MQHKEGAGFYQQDERQVVEAEQVDLLLASAIDRASVLHELQEREPLPLSASPSRHALRQQRFQELLESSREQVLQQIIGPFGLTTLMFDDKQGGNVTTQFNAEKDIYSRQCEQYRRKEYKYEAARKKKMREAVRSGQMNSNEFTDTYTGEKAATKREDRNGMPVMNAELDHTIPLKQAHREGGWMLDKAERSALSSDPANLNYTTMENNREKGHKSAESSLSSEKGYDESLTKPVIEKARSAIDDHLPTMGERVQHHTGRLLVTGAEQSGRNALRKAMGVVMHEFVNGSFVEVVRIVREPESKVSLVDQILAALKRVMTRVQAKLRAALKALLVGGIEGFVSNLMTFVINTFVTTSAKVVTVIREGAGSLFQAIKMLAAPAEGRSSMDIARDVTKVLAGVVTTSLGLLLEQSVNGFLLGIPLLAPLTGILSPVITAILTGLMAALVVYGIDRLFDALTSPGTEHLQAQLEGLEADARLGQTLAELVASQAQMVASNLELAQMNAALAETFATNAQALDQAHEGASRTQDAYLRTGAALEVAGASTLALEEEMAAFFIDMELDETE